MAISGIASLFAFKVTAVVLFGAAAILLALAFIVKPKNNKGISAIQNELADANRAIAENKTNKSAVQEKIDKINAQINALSLVLGKNTAVKEQQLAELKQKNEDLEDETKKAHAAKAEVINL